jgi:hypothetical protein
MVTHYYNTSTIETVDSMVLRGDSEEDSEESDDEDGEDGEDIVSSNQDINEIETKKEI